MNIAIKICGITTMGALYAAIKARVDYIGFVFYNQSPRNINLDFAAELKTEIPPNIKTVAVMVSPSDQMIKEVIDCIKPDYIQLDDSESLERLEEIKVKFGCRIIKTIFISDQADLELAKKFQEFADIIMFDSKHPNDIFVEQPEAKFDWGILKQNHINIPWMLSGGLNKYNVQTAIFSSGAKIINASSTLEDVPGIKEPHLIEEFVEAARIESFGGRWKE